MQKFTSNLINNYDTFLFDCDGVLYYGDTPIKTAINVVNKLIDLNKNVYFIVFIYYINSQITIH